MTVQTVRRTGFTLVELLVVIAIIGVMVGLLLPAVQAAREAARRMSCSNNLKQIGLAFHNYESTFRTFPYGFMVHTPSGNLGNPVFTNAGTWALSILPFIEQQALYDLYDRRVPAYDQAEAIGFPAAIATINRQVVSTPIATFVCPSAPGAAESRIFHANYSADGFPFTAGPGHPATFRGFAPSDYTANYGLRGIYRQLAFQGAGLPVPGDAATDGPLIRGGNNIGGLPGVGSSRMADILDGTSRTIVIGERTGGAEMYVGRRRVTTGPMGTRGPLNGGGWADILNGWHHTHGSLQNDDTGNLQGPCAINCTNLRNRGWHSFHPGGAHMLMGDASIQFVSESVEALRFAASLTRNGGEPASLNN